MRVTNYHETDKQNEYDGESLKYYAADRVLHIKEQFGPRSITLELTRDEVKLLLSQLVGLLD